jgi:hypothetical protein
MHKIMQLISNFLYENKMPPFMELHVYYVNFMKITWKFQSLEILTQKVAREMIYFLNNLVAF